MGNELQDSRDKRDDVTGSFVDWTKPAEYLFTDEVDALVTLQELGEELRAAREQVRHITRYLHEAVVAAHRQAEVSPTAIVRESGLARQTVYTALGKS